MRCSKPAYWKLRRNTILQNRLIGLTTTPYPSTLSKWKAQLLRRWWGPHSFLPLVCVCVCVWLKSAHTGPCGAISVHFHKRAAGCCYPGPLFACTLGAHFNLSNRLVLGSRVLIRTHTYILVVFVCRHWGYALEWPQSWFEMVRFSSKLLHSIFLFLLLFWTSVYTVCFHGWMMLSSWAMLLWTSSSGREMR
jgi:hypothetical protein